MKIPNLIYCLLIVFVVSCAEESRKDLITLHPMQEKIPHSEVDADMLELLDGGEYLNLLPKNVQLFYSFLNDEAHDAVAHELDLLTTNRLDISAVNDSTLLIFEKDNNRLIQYNLMSDTYEVIASQGRGPGDLLFAQELTVYQNKAAIGMGLFQISVFTCDDGVCDYEKTIKTEYNNYSLALGEDYIYYLGIARFGYEQDPDPADTNQNLIHKIDYNGEEQLSYLPIYNFRAPMVRDRMSSGGRVRIYPHYMISVVTFDFYPYIYIHNMSGELLARYEIPGLIQPYYEYEEKKDGGWESRLIYDSNSRNFFTSKLNNKWLFMRIREQRDLEFISLEEGFSGTEWYSYYMFDVDEKRLYKLGDDQQTTKPSAGAGRILHVIDQGLVINNEGSLFLVEM